MLRMMSAIVGGALVLIAISCGGSGGSSGTPWQWDLPEGFPVPIVPEDNPMTVEKVELGRFLFYDTRLSGNGTQSCASCHLQEMAFAEDLVVSEGSTGELTPRNSPTLTNVAYNSTYTWPNPDILTLEEQHLGPMFGEAPVELGINDSNRDEVLGRFQDDPMYIDMFDAAFGRQSDPINFDNIRKAIASFVRTIISGNSPWDKRTYQGQQDAVSDSALRGAGLFFSERFECFHCHGSFNFSAAATFEGQVFRERSFANTGLYNVDGEGAYPLGDQGLIEITGEPTDMGRFKSPTLRNIALTAPYLHDGTAETLGEVIDIYAAGGRVIEEGENAGDGSTNPFRSTFINGFDMTEQERDDLIAFLEALTDEDFLTDERISNPFE